MKFFRSTVQWQPHVAERQITTESAFVVGLGFIPHSTGMPLWGVLPSLVGATKQLYKGVLYFFLSQCIHHYIILTFSSKTHLYDCRDSCCREGKMMMMPRNIWADWSIWIHMMILQGGGVGGKSATKQLQGRNGESTLTLERESKAPSMWL